MATQAKTKTAQAEPVQVNFIPHADKPETKNCYRLDEVTESGMPPKIGTLYIQKWAVGNKLPERLTLTITVK
jgi:hypothetical protein